MEHSHYEALQVEALRRHDQVLQDSAARHEELLKLLNLSHPELKLGCSRSSLGTGNRCPSKAHHGENSGPPQLRESREKGILPGPQRAWDLKGEGERPGGNSGSIQHKYHIPHPKLDFLVFQGEEPRA